MYKHFPLLVSATALSLMLTACGGAGSTDKVSSTSNTLQPQPHKVSMAEISTSRLLARSSASAISVTTEIDKVTITYNDSSIATSNKHYQFFINIDENTSTGFQFEDEAWSQSGADYLTEDNELYKSTGNDDSWSWNYVSDISVNRTTNSFSVTLDKLLLQGLGSQLRVGFIIRNSDWNTEDFYPKSAEMSPFTIDTNPNNDTKPPVITLNGADVMRVEKGSVFVDPGAIAIDNVDGDITDKIEVFDADTVDTSVANRRFFIAYRVYDNAGNEAYISRTVLIVDSNPDEIVVDGNTDDWTDITPIGDITNRMYIRDSENNLSLLVQFDNSASNTQIFFDSDYDAATGLLLFGSAWGASGIDYMIENSKMYKKTASTGWSWESAGDIDYIRKGGVIEMSIPKSNFANLAANIGIGFIKRDANWNIISELLPKNNLFTYSLNNQSNIQIPSGTRALLCNNATTSHLTRQFEEDSFEDGFEFVSIDGVRKVYFSTLNDGIYTLSVRLPDGTENKMGDYDFRPVIDSTEGALYFRVTNSPEHIAKRYRINEHDLPVFVVLHGKGSSIPRVSYINGNDYYLEKFARGEKESTLMKVTHDAERAPFYETLYSDNGNPSLDHLKVNFQYNFSNLEDGTLFYAYTQGETRIIGAINSTGRIHSLSSCSH